ncbi:hypothetical protein RHD99_08350 [Buttiauxella selenatireducens]|uniref:Uncharacterized protein n=1 Tax=Buttiauxella selenatireducens TaxID=3073902 RepID=A0ABY9SEJ5_9ENTR|nr:hypothetical protein [Buttiauxella sp. R73]WMY75933.1 hypothetical protein RHD99_08350 [Buttiauxella sp. R73]
MFKKTYQYEVVKNGTIPTWDKNSLYSFQNPVSIGDKVKVLFGSELVEVVNIEHYPNISVIYVK